MLQLLREAQLKLEQFKGQEFANTAWASATMKVMDDLNFRYVYNPSYMPLANPIEECFSVAKRVYKKLKLNGLAKGNELDHERMIRKGFESVNRELV